MDYLVKKKKGHLRQREEHEKIIIGRNTHLSVVNNQFSEHKVFLPFLSDRNYS